ncbi:hypothetical protein NPIL_540791 [Nephila pilipes]|uniref:DUF7041 domain-containing protein n=1 Tax=Nephila pilipes TaxID=299642 RepID=A0A8X6P7R1_NEPPI|nr:hypothetical protein NPIL_540791 [Nephila pilipes]
MLELQREALYQVELERRVMLRKEGEKRKELKQLAEFEKKNEARLLESQREEILRVKDSACYPLCHHGDKDGDHFKNCPEVLKFLADISFDANERLYSCFYTYSSLYWEDHRMMAEMQQMGLTIAIATSTGNDPGSNSNNIESPSLPQVAAVSVKPPPFWTDTPGLWFAHVEAQFHTAEITVEETNYFTVVGALVQTVLNAVIKKPDNFFVVNDDFLKSLWLNQLPKPSQTILATNSESLDNLVTMANKTHEQCLYTLYAWIWGY